MEKNTADFSEVELEKSINLIGGLLESNWHGIQKAIHDNPDSKCSVSISLKLNHLSSDIRNVKANVNYSVKSSDEAECIVNNPNQLEIL